MKTLICILAFAFAAKASLLPHHDDEVAHFTDNHNQHLGSNVHFGESSSIVIDVGDRHADAAASAIVDHPHHHHFQNDVVVDHHAVDVHHQKAAKIVHHEPIHQIEPVHHVTKVVHHQPHHFVHYNRPVVDHHIVENDVNHAPAPAAYIHHHAAAPIIDHHHHHSAPIVHHHSAPILRHSHSALVHNDLHALNLVSLAKHHLGGKFGKLRITEKHYD